MDIYVENLPSTVTADDLRGVFEPFGAVETADLLRYSRGDKSSGFGLVGMPVRSEDVCAVLGVHAGT